MFRETYIHKEPNDWNSYTPPLDIHRNIRIIQGACHESKKLFLNLYSTAIYTSKFSDEPSN